MVYRTRNLSKYRKAQFFVLSAFTIVTILYFISQWVAPYTIPDTSKVAMMEEPYIFNNVVEKAQFVIKNSTTCEDLKFNLEEYKYFVERYAFGKNIKLDFNYTVAGCSFVDIQITLRHPDIDLARNLTMTWPS